MASRKDNLKSLMTNARTRVIIVFTGLILLIGLVVGYYKFFSNTAQITSGSNVSSTPGDISSTPGALNQTAEYARLQSTQNEQSAQKALQQGTSSIPTLIDLKSLGDGVETVGPQGGTGGLGFSALSQLGQGAQKPLWLQNLSASNCSSDSISQAVSSGASIADLRNNNCSCDALKSYGFKLNQLITECECSQLRNLGFTAADFNAVGYNASQLKICGFSACETKAAGYSATQMKNGGYSDGELSGAGFTPEQIASASGLPSTVTANEVKQAGCSPDGLKSLMQKGVSGAAIRRISGCDVTQLKAAGFSPTDLKDAGFTAAELKAAGFSAQDLKNAGFDPAQLLNAGYTAGDLAQAGFSNDDIKRASSGLPDGVSPFDVKAAGCSADALAKERAAGVSASAIARFAGCTANALKAGGFSPSDLLGVNLPSVSGAPCELDKYKVSNCDVNQISQLRAVGTSVAKIQALNHCSAQQLKTAGYPVADLLSIGISPEDLLAAGFNANDINTAYAKIAQTLSIPDGVIISSGCDPLKLGLLKRSGVAINRIQTLNKCQVSDYKAACFSPGQLLSVGFASSDLIKVGYDATQISSAQATLRGNQDTSDNTIKQAACNAKKIQGLRDLGITAARIESLNHCNANIIKAANYCVADLLSAGFSPSELTAIGVNQQDIQMGQNQLAGLESDQCISSSDISDNAIGKAGCDPNKLAVLQKNGVSVKRIIQLNNCNPKDLKQAGFSAQNLLDAGLPSSSLADAGFSPDELSAANKQLIDALANGKSNGCTLQAAQAAKNAGLSVVQIRKSLGCTASTLLGAGFSPKDLKNGGFTVGELAKNGIGLPQLLAAGFSPSDLKSAGFSAQDLKAAGVSPADLLSAGFKPNELLASGLTAKDLLNAGMTPADLKKIGYDAQALKNAGLSASQLKAAGYDASALKQAGFSDDDLQAAGINPKDDALAQLTNLATPQPNQPASSIASIPNVTVPSQPNLQEDNLQNLNTALQEQKKMQAAMKFQQKIQQKTSALNSYATQLINDWKQFTAQVYVVGNEKNKLAATGEVTPGPVISKRLSPVAQDGIGQQSDIFVKTGEILFAVIDTSINSDEPGPILATIVSGALKGSKLIGSFNLPSRAGKMIITFTTLSVPGIDKTQGISAYAIDPNTGRTALASSTNYHYLQRYGSLFASTFLEGFGNAFQSANTTITIGGVGGATNTTVQNGLNRSLTSNAVIGLATLGKSWGQQAQQNMAVPTTVQVCAGTPIGVLFLQDVTVDPNQSK
jgi:intracellular multiplication protein IcmE